MKRKKVRTVVKKTDNTESLKAVIALLILLLGFSVLILFKTYQGNIIESSFQAFMLLVILGMGMLVGLLYLVNKK